jgi:hypothetical protein
MDETQKQIIIMTEDIKRLKEDTSDIKSLIKSHMEKEDERYERLCENMDKKYASKQTEKLVYGMVGIILTAIVVAVSKLVIK